MFHFHAKSGLLIGGGTKRRHARYRVVSEHRLVGRIGDDFRRKVELDDNGVASEHGVALLLAPGVSSPSGVPPARPGGGGGGTQVMQKHTSVRSSMKPGDMQGQATILARRSSMMAGEGKKGNDIENRAPSPIADRHAGSPTAETSQALPN